MRIMTHALLASAAGALLLASGARPAFADAAANVTGDVRTLKTGADIYEHVCQGCHMPDAKGAIGAGARFPALAGNPKLKTASYPIYVVMNGFGGMPWFSNMLDDQQVADVVTYVRTHFGNNFAEPVKASDVAPLRANAPHSEE